MDYTPEFRKTLDLIYSFTMNGRKNRRNLGKKESTSLELMRSLMIFFGNPENNYQVIHVAGTKGKGSTANFIANSLIQAGYKVGLYTSPHLQDFSERIQVNNGLIPHEDVANTLDRMKPFFETHIEVNTFEIITAIAFEHFNKEKVDIAVVEVGLGGRLDATNVVEPILSVITSISFDHVDLLGDTLSKIAFEKAGIIKKRIPVVIGKQKDEALEVLHDVAAERVSDVIDVPAEVSVQNVKTSYSGHSFSLVNKNEKPLKLSIPLLGYHQLDNAMIAYAALMKCQEMGLEVTYEDIQSGFSTVKWPARFEVISETPMIVIDGAHNVDSIQRMLEATALVFPDKKIRVLAGFSMGKDVQGMLTELLSMCSSCIFTRSTHPKSMDPFGLVQLAKHLGYETSSEVTVEKALEIATKDLSKNEVLLCTGSLFVAAAVRSIWNNMKPYERD